MARTYLFRRSLDFAVHHPLFGVGPGEFADILESEGKREGRHETSLGTHNTYTQLASECGIPALLMFVAAIVITIRSSYRLYKATMHDPTQATISALAFICFVLTVAYSIDIFFHHMAYYGNMPLLLGLWIAVEFAARQSRMAQQAAVG
jgi:O-antigen ligase